MKSSEKRKIGAKLNPASEKNNAEKNGVFSHGENAPEASESSLSEPTCPKKAKDGKTRRKKEKTAKNQSAAIHIEHRSFLALLIRSYVSFILITLLSAILIFGIANWANDRGQIFTNSRTIANYKNELENGKFKNIPVELMMGKSGWLTIVDTDGNNVYSSDKETREYSLSELDFILNFGSGEKVSERRFKVENGQYNHLISRSIIIDGEEIEQYLLLDSDLRVISGTVSINKTQLTERELELYVYNANHGEERLFKYYFTDKDDNGFYAIYLDTNGEEGVTPYVFAIVVGILILGLVAALLILYIRYINKHVQRPLKDLSAAMNDFTKNNYREKLSYSGIKEFEQLVDSFNEMATLLNASEEQRNMLEADRQRMLAGLSHDLKTPITIIQGFSKAIRDGVVGEEDKQKYLNLIIAKSEHMGELINEFYEYSKLDHPDFRLNSEDLDIAEFIRTYIAGRYEEFELQGYAVDADITEERLISNADKAQFARVFDNLISNFFKYTPKGSTLYVKAFKEGENAKIIFADNGAGIPASASEDIFTPFVVGEASRNKQGSGLGLAICTKIVTAHGGTISLNPAPIEDCKTQFDITVPLVE